MPAAFFNLITAALVPLLLGIVTPSSGAVLRGAVSITGGTEVPDGQFSHYELSFAYAGDATGTWFLIATSSQPVEDGTLATWDTTAISDGDYSLRLRVFLQDGTTMDVTVTDLHVRNDVPLPTATPPVAAQDLPSPTPSMAAAASAPAAATATFVQPTALEHNPAALTDDSVLASLRRGAVFAVIAVALIGLFLRLRSEQ
jgi:hypothetical protein